MRDAVFFSYSREDQRWLSELKTALAAGGNDVRLNVWDDSRISPSEQWPREIEEALATAAAAVLLLSPDFFKSDYISRHELPPLIAAARHGELKLFPVIISACAHEEITGTFQAINDPAKPVATLNDAEREAVWERLLDQMKAVGAGIADETRIGAEMTRLANDLAARPEIQAINEKIERAGKDPDLQGNYRENALCFLEGQRCQMQASALMEEMQRPNLTPHRSKAIVRTLESVQKTEEKALARVTELTKIFADETMEMLKAAKPSGNPSN